MYTTIAHLATLILWACVVSHAITAADGFASSGSHRCKGIRTKRHAQISKPPNISGSWFSPSCELLPGPQYLLRQYEFSRTNRFTITRYYYSDEFCREVSHCIQARGVITDQSPSWYLSEATDTNFELTELTVKPYTAKMSRVLSETISGSCNVGEADDRWMSNSFQSLHVNASNQDCLQSLTFSVNELLVMRQVDYYKEKSKIIKYKEEITPSYIPTLDEREEVPSSDVGRERRMSADHMERELQLGNGVWFSQLARPSSYQPPLYTATHKHCEACACIYRADIDNPPARCHRGHITPPLPSNLTGQWFSQTCESVPYSLFTLRSYRFNETDSTFNITTHYFNDAFCTQPSFVVRAEGNFTARQLHPWIYNTRSYQLSFHSLSVGVLSDSMKYLLSHGNSTLCGHVTSWERGKLYDVTSTHGCDSLGIVLRNAEYVLIKVEQRHLQPKFLLLSEMKTNLTEFYDDVTYFSPKLQKCDGEPVRWVNYNGTDSRPTSSGVSSMQRMPSGYTYIISTLGVIYSTRYHSLRLYLTLLVFYYTSALIGQSL